MSHLHLPHDNACLYVHAIDAQITHSVRTHMQIPKCIGGFVFIMYPIGGAFDTDKFRLR